MSVHMKTQLMHVHPVYKLLSRGQCSLTDLIQQEELLHVMHGCIGEWMWHVCIINLSPLVSVSLPMLYQQTLLG